MDYRKLEKMMENFSCQPSNGLYLQLEPVVFDVSRSGVVRFPWKLMKPLLRYRLECVLSEAFDSAKNMPDDDKGLSRQLVERFDRFNAPPFTIQRLCELLVEPKRWYKRRSPFLRGLEKSLLVVTTAEPDLTWMTEPSKLISDEGKERLMQVDSVDSVDSDDISNSITTDKSMTSPPTVELSEADSTVSNGFDVNAGSHTTSPPPAKKQCLMDGDEDIITDQLSSLAQNNDTTTSSTTTTILKTLPED